MVSGSSSAFPLFCSVPLKCFIGFSAIELLNRGGQEPLEGEVEGEGEGAASGSLQTSMSIPWIGRDRGRVDQRSGFGGATVGPDALFLAVLTISRPSTSLALALALALAFLSSNR